MGLTYILVLYVANLYDHYQDFRRLEKISTIILSSLIGTLLVVIMFTLPSRHVLDRSFVEWQGVVLVWLLVFWRFSFSAIALPLRLQRKVLIIGAGKAGQEIHNVINCCKNSGLVVAGFLDDNPQKIGVTIAGTPVLGNSSQLGEIITSHRIGMLVMAITHSNPTGLLNNLVRFSLMGVQFIDMPSLYEFLAGKIPTNHISDVWLLIHSLNSNKVYYRHFKRITDLVLASLGLALTWPLWVLIAVAVKLDSPGTGLLQPGTLGERWQALPHLEIPHYGQ